MASGYRKCVHSTTTISCTENIGGSFHESHGNATDFQIGKNLIFGSSQFIFSYCFENSILGWNYSRRNVQQNEQVSPYGRIGSICGKDPELLHRNGARINQCKHNKYAFELLLVNGAYFELSANTRGHESYQRLP